ncbi:LysR family transcriptional regulator [Massilia sp. W12]|uniref:LysR family transcriptional regulator n=1 Tax=Massilia sp. W12 TaxID=3126507 RepID=UPI0030D56916
MKSLNINFHHLYYFWVVAKEGGVTRAAERLGVAVQTISTQVGLLEQSLGKSLLNLQGRRLVLTEAGRAALTYADQIFLLGEQLQEALSEDGIDSTLRLTVGISDALPKILAYHMLKATLGEQVMNKKIRLVCYEGKFESLLADLALHKLDVLLTDRSYNGSASVRVFSHRLHGFKLGLYGTKDLYEQYHSDFPRNLAGAPLLLPTRNTAIRGLIDGWMTDQKIRCELRGEFEDGALLKTFGGAGVGLFPAPMELQEDMKSQYNALPLGEMTGVTEECYAISNDRKIQHPALEIILSHANQALA